MNVYLASSHSHSFNCLCVAESEAIAKQVVREQFKVREISEGFVMHCYDAVYVIQKVISFVGNRRGYFSDLHCSTIEEVLERSNFVEVKLRHEKISILLDE